MRKINFKGVKLVDNKKRHNTNLRTEAKTRVVLIKVSESFSGGGATTLLASKEVHKSVSARAIRLTVNNPKADMKKLSHKMEKSCVHNKKKLRFLHIEQFIAAALNVLSV